jgi:hypothetical protein
MITEGILSHAKWAKEKGNIEKAREWAQRTWDLSLLGLVPLEEALQSGLAVEKNDYGTTILPVRKTRRVPVFVGANENDSYSVPMSYSVIVPVYNPEPAILMATLTDLLDSMVAQRLWRQMRGMCEVAGELWVVDDKSDDQQSVLQVVTEFRGRSLNVFRDLFLLTGF